MAECLKFILYASRKARDGESERKLIRDLTSRQADERTRELVNEGFGLIVSLPAAGSPALRAFATPVSSDAETSCMKGK